MKHLLQPALGSYFSGIKTSLDTWDLEGARVALQTACDEIAQLRGAIPAVDTDT